MKKAKDTRPAKTGPAALLPGMKDRLPDADRAWSFVTHELQRLARDHNYERLETPLVEEAHLFDGWRQDDEAAQRELFRFVGPDGIDATLRPSLLPGFGRAFREHGFATQALPRHLFSMGPVFRNERPSLGRYRQFTAFAFSVIGDAQSFVDAQLVSAMRSFFDDLLLETELHINSAGCDACRKKFIKQLQDHCKKRKAELCPLCQVRLTERPLELLTCIEPQCQAVGQDAPQLMDNLCDADRQHLTDVLEHLDDVEVPYVLSPRLLLDRPFDSRTVVQFRSVGVGGVPGFVLASGGRSETLMKKVGAEPLPLFAVTGGIERILLAMRDQNIEPPLGERPDIFLAHIGDEARRKSLKLFFSLRREGLYVAESLAHGGMKAQLELATKLGAKFALILGKKEIMDETILLRDMENGIQEVIDFQKTIPEVKRRLERIGNEPSRLLPRIVPREAEPHGEQDRKD